MPGNESLWFRIFPVVAILAWFCAVCGIAYIAVHFILKFW